MRRILILSMLLAGAGHAAARPLGSLDFEPCTLTMPGTALFVEAQCTTFEVPENRAEPDGRKIQLAIGWIPARNPAAPGEDFDPVFMLAGGPGQSARESYPVVSPAFADIRRTRDVILVDQRGTGASNPLHCKIDEADESLLTPTVEESRAQAERCRDALQQRADLRYYTTGDAVADLDAVRAAIGASKINLVGVSYGTRVAQQYALQYPEHTRAVVLDGVVPNTLVLGAEHARNLQDALQREFERCAATPVCKERFGVEAPDVDALLKQLDAAPVTVTYRDPTDYSVRTEPFTRGHLGALLRLYAYAPQTSAMLPLMLHEAEQGRFETLAAQARMIGRSLGEGMAQGMGLSVSCSEDAGELAPDPADADTVMGTEFVEYMRDICAIWPHGTRADHFRTPLDGALPVLLLSGEFDPVTPPRYGDDVAKALTNARHLTLRGQGHNVIGVGCAPKLVARFLDTLDAKALDAKCLDDLAIVPPFAGYYGWEP